MRNLFNLLLTLCILFSATNAQVNGYLEVVGDIPVLHLWGTDYEMGHAYGTIMGLDMVTLIENGVVPDYGGVTNYEDARTYFTNSFTVPGRMQTMADGIISGMADHPDSIIYSDVLGRDFDALDIHMGNSILDFTALSYLDMQMGCSSISAWGNSTINDPVVQGGAAMSRNYDLGPGSSIADHLLMISYSPDVGLDWVSISFTGTIGCISGMNEYGIAAAGNWSNHWAVSVYDPPFVPAFYRTAMGLLEEDFDSSGTHDLGDFVEAVSCTTWNNASSTCWHAIAPAGLEYNGERAIVVEIQNVEGSAVRVSADDPIIHPEHLILTNHHRLLFSPVGCSRYSGLSDSILVDPEIDLDRFWDFMVACDQGNTTYQTMIFNAEDREIGLAFADSSGEAFTKDPVWFTWDDLLGIEPQQHIDPIILSVFPNPTSGIITINYAGVVPSDVSVYNISGRRIESDILPIGNGTHMVDISDQPSGVYFILVTSDASMETRMCVSIRR